MRYVRINKGVAPYGGRRAILTEWHTYPNGRRVAWVVIPSANQEQGVREYREDEVSKEWSE